METYFYCQECDTKISIDQLALLNEGRCPQCGSFEGYSTMSKTEGNPFVTTTIINDTELFSRVLEEEN